MSSISYLYRITNLVENKHYYGSRTCNDNPKNDLGKKYFSSSTDKDFIKDQKVNPGNYRYKIIWVSDDRKKVNDFEERIHRKFNVGRNLSFYNRIINTDSGFNSTGRVTVKDREGNYYQISKDDPRYLSGELVSMLKDMVPVKDKNGNTSRVSINDPRYLSGELVHVTKGLFNAKDIDGNNYHISIDDPRYLSGELIHWSFGRNHTKESRQKISLASTIRNTGAGNPMYGRDLMWITDELTTRRIEKTSEIPKGWRRGRAQLIKQKAHKMEHLTGTDPATFGVQNRRSSS